MKRLIAPALLALSFTAGAQAGLLDHIAFASGNITAECSDYLGKVSAAGNITLRDFLVQDEIGVSGCALSAGGSVSFLRGSVTKAGAYSCIASKSVRQDKVGYSSVSRKAVDFSVLSQELDGLSSRLASLPGARVVLLNTLNYPNSGTIVLNGSAHELLIVRSLEINPVIEGVGVVLQGGVDQSNIVWDFPNAQTLRIAFSGVNPMQHFEHVGMPGTFIAPKATVSFQNALITGALYARNISAPANRADCSDLVSGQINRAVLRLPNEGGKPPGRSW